MLPSDCPGVPRRTPAADGERTGPTVLDLFAGAGGLSEAFAQAGYEIVAAVEKDEDAAATYAANFGPIVTHSPIGDWLATGNVPEVDVVVGGPPCQGFSALGRQDPDDPRNRLWNDYVDTVVLAQPWYFVVENVEQFSDNTQYEALKSETETGGRLANYRIIMAVLDAADFGAPQHRKRTIIVGCRECADPIDLKKMPRVDRHLTVQDAFEERGVVQQVRYRDLNTLGRLGLPRKEGTRRIAGPFLSTELHVDRRYRSNSLERFAFIREGGNRFDLPDRLKSDCWRKHTTGSGDVMGRLHWKKPSVTIRTEFTKPEKGRYLHPEEHRAITIYEGAVLQGFPDDYLWMGSRTSITKQIGNAVPIQLGLALAKSIAAGLRGQEQEHQAVRPVAPVVSITRSRVNGTDSPLIRDAASRVLDEPLAL